MKSKEQKPCNPGFLSLPRRPTGRSSGRGLCIWLRSGALPPRRLARSLGASKKEQKRAGRQGPRRYLAVAVLEGKASVCTTCFFGLWLPFAVWRFVPARRCSNPAWCKPSGPWLPRSALARVSGWAARFRFWLGRRAKYRPCPKPNPPLKGTRGYDLACFP